MSVNWSSSSNDSLLHPNVSSNNSDLPVNMNCLISTPGSFIFTMFLLTSILLLLPLCIFILYHALQQWRGKRSTSSAAATSPSDSFTYHMVTMELLGVFGCVLCCSGIYSHHYNILSVGLFLMSFKWCGELSFHLLTCVERYLAVVHPITYLSLRTERGIRIRNISIGCVWLLCFVEMGLQRVEILVIVTEFCLMILSLSIVSFCSLSVLRVLIRPGPGEQGGARQRVDQSKQRAFHTILAILGVLVLRFSWGLVWSVVSVSGADSHCVIMTVDCWISLPSSLLLPLLFLHRAGKLMCWKNNIQKASGRD